VETKSEFFRVCEEFLNHGGPLPLEPFPVKTKAADPVSCVG